MNLAFSGLGEVVGTFSGSVEVGDIITIGANASVTKAVADKDIMGVCVSTRGKLVGIAIRGTCELAYTGTAPNVGYNLLNTSGDNAIKVSASGKSFLVLNVDTVTKKVVVLL